MFFSAYGVDERGEYFFSKNDSNNFDTYINLSKHSVTTTRTTKNVMINSVKLIFFYMLYNFKSKLFKIIKHTHTIF